MSQAKTPFDSEPAPGNTLEPSHDEISADKGHTGKRDTGRSPPEVNHADAAPAGASESNDRGAASIHYLRAYAQVFDSPQWALNLLLVTVSQFIPVVGYMVVCGYTYENVEAWHRKPRWIYPPFEFDRFGDYLTRGVWPGLIVVLLGVIFYPLFIVGMYILMFAAILVGMLSGNYAPITLGVAIPCFLLLGSCLSLMLILLIRVVMLGAGLSQDLTVACRPKWIRGFVARVWLELLLATLFSLVTWPILYVGGSLLLLVGVFPALSLWSMGWAHLDYQLYQLYLARGGKPLPLKPPPRHLAEAWLSPG